MANISLTSYVLSDLGEKITELTSLGLPDGRPRPDGFFICLYGARDSITALQDAHIKARKENKVLKRFDLDLVGNESPLSRVNHDNAADTVYLNVTRLTKDLEGDIIRLISTNPKQRSLPVIIDENPEIIEKIFELDMFKHLNVIIWPASWKTGHKIQVAAVKDASKIVIKKSRVEIEDGIKIAA